METTRETQLLQRHNFFVIFAIITLSLFSTAVYAQDKTQAYYNQHEREIYPDAQAAFLEGKYERAVLLCRWHYIIVGDNAADSLRAKAEDCQQLLDEMNSLVLQGLKETALEKARALLALNPEDIAAKTLVLETEAETELEESAPVEEEEVVAPPIPIAVEVPPTQIEEPVTSKTRFSAKAGISILDLKQAAQSCAFGGGVGAYEIMGSGFGGGLGILFSPSLSGTSSLFEFDAAITYKVSEMIYPLVSAGFFSCKSKTGTSSTAGMCAGIGLSFLFGEHFCLDVVGKYYPKVSVQSAETMNVHGISTEFITVTDVISGGLAPFLSFGYVF